jgi:hypothetical protein
MTITKTYKIARSASFRSMDRDPAGDYGPALQRWAARNGSRSYREIGEAGGFLLVELRLDDSDAAQAGDDLMSICDEKQLTLSEQW